jgi:ubiquinone/menaquinone biosynthesis C-methylase UbiE
VAASPDHSDSAAAWSAGNYARIGSALLYISEVLLETMDVRAGQSALDVACGHGNAVLAAARRSCRATGVDCVPELLEVGRQRAAADGLRAEFVLGDAEAIPFPDSSFDIVTSVLGSMFATNQEQAASELLRVCKPGGKIGLASWSPTGYALEFNRLAHGGDVAPLRWGTREGINDLFGNLARDVQFEDREFIMRAPSVERFVAHFEHNFGPLAEVAKGLPDDDRQSLLKDFGDAALRYNRSSDDTLASPMAYLQVLMVKT